MPALDKCTVLSCKRCHSCSVKLLFLILSDSISASPEIKRFTSCTSAISKEKIITFLLKSNAALRIKLRAKAVLPIAGRAARMIKSDGCQPEVMRSRSLKPVATPVIPELSVACRNSNSFNACCTRALMSRKLLFKPAFLIS